jgi:hypothetical protein
VRGTWPILLGGGGGDGQLFYDKQPSFCQHTKTVSQADYFRPAGGRGGGTMKLLQ